MRYRVEGTKRTFGDDVERGGDVQVLEAATADAAADLFLQRNEGSAIVYWTVERVEEAD